MTEKDEVVLSFHDSLLRKSDVDLLRGQFWLNDSLISFFFEYLEKGQSEKNKDVGFISPEVTQCLKVGPPSELPVFLDPLGVKDRNFVILAVNDCVDPESPGGSHWSMLAYSRPEETFFHFDSSTGSNHKHAETLADKLSAYLAPKSKFNFVEAECFQQSNCYDCGIHVIAQSELISKHVAEHQTIKGHDLLSKQILSNQRARLLELIFNLQQTKQ